ATRARSTSGSPALATRFPTCSASRSTWATPLRRSRGSCSAGTSANEPQRNGPRRAAQSHFERLLLYRLLRQPNGFEGGLLVVELAVSSDLARADREGHVDARTHARPAHPSARVLVSNHEHVVAAVDESLGLAPVLIPMLEPSFKGLLHTFVPVIDAAIGALRVLDPFDVGGARLRDEVGQGREQRLLVDASGPGEETFHELHVLLRHRL